MASDSALEKIPSDLFSVIASNLQPCDVLHLSLCSKILTSKILNNDDFWANFYRSYFHNRSQLNQQEQKDQDWDPFMFWKSLFKCEFGWKWGESPEKFSPVYKISDDKLTLTRTLNGDYNRHMVIGSKGMRSGKRYWEIHVDRLKGGAPYLLIGIVGESYQLQHQFLGSINNGVCYASVGNFLRDAIGNRYSKPFGEGDTIGVFVDLERKGGSLMFFKNGKDLGWAWEGFFNEKTWSGNIVYPAVATPYEEINEGTERVRITANFKAKCPPIKKQ